MANRFWVGGTANWDATAGTKWATISGGAGGSAVPTAADDVFFDAGSGSGVIVTIPTGTVNCRSLTMSTLNVAVSLSSATSILNIGDASGGALTIGSGDNFSAASTSATINFVSTSTNGGAGWGITTGGATLPNVNFTGVGGKWVNQDAMATNGAITHTGGEWATGGLAVTAVSFISSGASARVLTLGTSAILISGGSSNGFQLRSTNLTVTANTAVVTVTSSASSISLGAQAVGASIDFNGMSFVVNGTSPTVVLLNGNNATSSLKSLTITGTSVKTVTMTTGGTWNISGALAFSGNSATNRLLVQSATVGTTMTFALGGSATCKTGGTQHVDFMDITMSGGAANERDLSAITGKSGDCQGNSGITFTTSATQTATGTASFTWSTHGWTTRVPLPQDDVVIANAFVAGRTVTADMPRLGRSISFAGATGSPAFARSLAVAVFGSFTMASGMTVTGAFDMTFSGRGSYSLTSAGVQIIGNVLITAPGDTYTLLDAFNCGSTFQVNNGRVIDGGFTHTVGAFASSNPNVRTLNFTGAWNLTGTSTFTLWQTSNITNLTATSLPPIVLTGASVNAHNFVGGGLTFPSLTYTVANSPGPLVIQGSSTFTTLNVGSGRRLTLPSATTTTVTNWNVQGGVNGYTRLPGVSGSYISAPDSAALSITGDIDLRIRRELDALIAAGFMGFVGKWATSQFSYSFGASSTGSLQLSLSGNGTTQTNATSSVGMSTVASPFQDMWWRVTWRKSDGRTQFFYANGALTNPVAADFTQLGTDQTLNIGGVANTAMFDSTAAVEIGTTTSGTVANGVGIFYRAQVRNGIDGTLVFDADLTLGLNGRTWIDAAATQFAESSAQAATVTLNGTAVQGDGRVTVDASTGASAATLATTAGATSAYATVMDSTATPSGAVYDLDGKSVSNNTGWVFSPPSELVDGLGVTGRHRGAIGTSSAAQRAGSR